MSAGSMPGEPVIQVDVAALYEAHQQKMHSAAFSVLGPNGLASEVGDAVQTVVANLMAMHQKGTLTPRDDWGGYLWKSARNAGLKIVRQRRQTDSLDQRLEERPDDADQVMDRTEGFDPVGDTIDVRDQVLILREAMVRLKLDPRRERIIRGYFFEEMTDAQLGLELGISSQRVGVLRRATQNSLGEQLKGGG